MKKQILPVILGMIILAFLFGTLQAQTVTLTFTGKDANNYYVQLNHVAITNLTKGWQETIYWPDTTLTMQNSTGIDESIADGGFGLLQNNPNPFTGTTDVNLTVADAGAVTLESVDANGKILETRLIASLQPRTNHFRVSLSAAGTYILTARQNGKTSSIKMVCNGAGNGNGIEYIGIVETPYYDVSTMIIATPKSHTRGTTNNPFTFGDMMEYVGYAIINGTEVESQRITQAQGTSQTFALQFAVSQYQIPTVTTTAVTDITHASATCGGNVTSDGGTNITARGVCWSTSPNPTISSSHTTNGNGTGSFTSILTELSDNTIYYVRAYATNSVGTAYGNEVSFTARDGQPCPGTPTITDIDGNTYNTVQIGQQCWMKENLRTTQYADGTPIAQNNWAYPDSVASNQSTYGLLYNWATVMRNSPSSSANPSGVQGICPTGWHVPSDAEWKQLEMEVGMSQHDADSTGYRGDIAAKLSGNTGWMNSSQQNSPGNTSAVEHNSSGFSALPAGAYQSSGTGYYNMYASAIFWTATQVNNSRAWRRWLMYCYEGVLRIDYGKDSCQSVRCVKD